MNIQEGQVPDKVKQYSVKSARLSDYDQLSSHPEEDEKMIDTEHLKQQAISLKLHGLLAHWPEVTQEQYPWLETLLSWEYKERKQRSLERRLNHAKLGHFKPLNEFDWQWPDKIDPQAIQAFPNVLVSPPSCPQTGR